MFGARPAPVGIFPTVHEQADRRLFPLSAHLLRQGDAAEHVAQLVHEGTDDDGAMLFASLLFLADELEGARFWWGFAAGAGNGVAAKCLHLYHLSRGELRDADHWALEAETRGRPHRPPARPQDAPCATRPCGRPSADSKSTPPKKPATAASCAPPRTSPTGSKNSPTPCKHDGPPQRADSRGRSNTVINWLWPGA
ncbi:hypothetical protein [Streptomyces sp. NPDC093111]|uniref:hypothetical protein n=1 Tax=Streptomyces sp. NPDC093111 TaxID=3154978 RepID=UPI003444425C